MRVFPKFIKQINAGTTLCLVNSCLLNQAEQLGAMENHIFTHLKFQTVSQMEFGSQSKRQHSSKW